MSFFRWVTLYFSVANNVFGEDRIKMVAAWDDDEKFDRWLEEMDKKRKMQDNPKAKDKTYISNEEYLRKYAKTYGDDPKVNK